MSNEGTLSEEITHLAGTRFQISEITPSRRKQSNKAERIQG